MESHLKRWVWRIISPDAWSELAFSNLSKPSGSWCNGLSNKNGESRPLGMEVHGTDAMSSSVATSATSIISLVVAPHLPHRKVLYWHVLQCCNPESDDVLALHLHALWSYLLDMLLWAKFSWMLRSFLIVKDAFLGCPLYPKQTHMALSSCSPREQLWQIFPFKQSLAWYAILLPLILWIVYLRMIFSLFLTCLCWQTEPCLQCVSACYCLSNLGKLLSTNFNATV